MPVTTPYRFARINRRVFFPDWADNVSHDVPFADGISGTIALNIKTITPLLVGGKREAGTPGTVHPFKIGNDWAIPGSSVQGVIRQLLEVACFGKLGPIVHDRRFGVRDIAPGATAAVIYRDRLVNKVRTGWLMKGNDKHRIIRCKMERIAIADLIGRFPDATETLAQRNNAQERLDAVVGTGDDQDLSKLSFQLDATPATLVLTGKTNAGIEDHPTDKFKNPKKQEFIFYNPSRDEAQDSTKYHARAEVDSDVWRDFLLIHDPEPGSGGKINPNWNFWRGEFLAGRPVPVFYLEERGRISALGMAQMFKLAMQKSTHDLLQNSSPDHLDRGQFDLPSLIFGAVGGDGQKDSWYAHNLKRRASFDLFRRIPPGAQPAALETDWQILLAPKPNYYPHYVRQDPKHNITQPYAAYHAMAGGGAARTHPELAGTKIWPVHRTAHPQPQPQNAQQRELIRNVANHLRSVPKEQTFAGALRIHNLRPVELGALLWALTFGGEENCHHRIGGAKPLGFGEVQISIGEMDLLPNDPTVQLPDQGGLIAKFVAAMNEFHGNNWADSPQIRALIKAAQPGTQGLEYPAGGHQPYATARQNNEFMPDYVDCGEELTRDLDAINLAIDEQQKAAVAARAAEAAAQIDQHPHLAFAARLAEIFPNREQPPTEFAGYPETDAFEIGDQVILDGGLPAIILGYPALRGHPTKLGKVKWVVGYVNANGTQIVEERVQAGIRRLE